MVRAGEASSHQQRGQLPFLEIPTCASQHPLALSRGKTAPVLASSVFVNILFTKKEVAGWADVCRTGGVQPGYTQHTLMEADNPLNMLEGGPLSQPKESNSTSPRSQMAMPWPLPITASSTPRPTCIF